MLMHSLVPRALFSVFSLSLILIISPYHHHCIHKLYIVTPRNIRKNQLFLLHLITSYSSYFGGKKGISGNKTSFFLLMNTHISLLSPPPLPLFLMPCTHTHTFPSSHSSPSHSFLSDLLVHKTIPVLTHVRPNQDHSCYTLSPYL